MGYNAGTLDIELLGYSSNAVSSIDATAKALGKLSSALNKMKAVSFALSGEKLQILFTDIAKATNSIDTKNIQRLADAAKSLSAISRLGKLENIDYDKVGKGFNSLTVAITPFVDKVKEAEGSLNALYAVLSKSSGKKIQGLLDTGDNKKSSRSGIFGAFRLTTTLYVARRLANAVGSIVQAGSDYNETLNLWQVAMRENLDLADEFVNKMNKAYGISTKTVMEAQAIFKNMIGSLGQISDEVAYQLSEALVQMSADFASLYNTSIESAFTKMQSMLAGQVRPIRSAGLDMTETTLFMFYQQLGGTKTMRQLNRTEKQLLSILAVYQQMGAAGALGDMTKTLNTFANQSRMMTEYWAELKTWTGLVLKDLIDQSGALIYINSALITMSEVMKAIAKSRGLGDENYIDGLFETTEATNDAVDELQGKLLDFDKFRSLEGATASPLAIDEKLLQAITGYSSKIDQAQNSAQKLAETWLSFLGFTKNSNGEFVTTEENLRKIEAVLGAIKTAIITILAIGVYSTMVRFGKGLYTYCIVPLIDLGKAIWSNAIQPFISWVKNLVASHSTIQITTAKVTALQAAFAALSLAILAVSFTHFLSTEMSSAQRVTTIFIALAAAITAAAVAMHLLQMNWAGALSAAGLVAGSVFAVSAAFPNAIPNYETGASDIDSGTIFRAGEFGKTEAVFTGSNGKTNVANIQQMKAAYSQALNEWWSSARNDIPQFAEASPTGLYQTVKGEAKRRGDW